MSFDLLYRFVSFFFFFLVHILGRGSPTQENLLPVGKLHKITRFERFYIIWGGWRRLSFGAGRTWWVVAVAAGGAFPMPIHLYRGFTTFSDWMHSYECLVEVHCFAIDTSLRSFVAFANGKFSVNENQGHGDDWFWCGVWDLGYKRD